MKLTSVLLPLNPNSYFKTLPLQVDLGLVHSCPTILCHIPHLLLDQGFLQLIASTQDACQPSSLVSAVLVCCSSRPGASRWRCRRFILDICDRIFHIVRFRETYIHCESLWTISWGICSASRYWIQNSPRLSKHLFSNNSQTIGMRDGLLPTLRKKIRKPPRTGRMLENGPWRSPLFSRALMATRVL